MNKTSAHSVVIVDDHLLFAGSLEKLINSFPGFRVLYHSKNGAELKEKLPLHPIPDVILLDINMPVMNGFETVRWLTNMHPEIKVLALSMDDDENTIIKMLRGGARGYLLKDIHPDILEEGLQEVIENGFYHSQKITDTIIHAMRPPDEAPEITFKENELTFMQLACSEMTYKEIASVMNLSPKTIDGYRQELFNKLNIKNRVGLVLYALKNKLIKI